MYAIYIRNIIFIYYVILLINRFTSAIFTKIKINYISSGINFNIKSLIDFAVYFLEKNSRQKFHKFHDFKKKCFQIFTKTTFDSYFLKNYVRFVATIKMKISF